MRRAFRWSACVALLACAGKTVAPADDKVGSGAEAADASSSAPPTASAEPAKPKTRCDAFPMAVCNFDGTCPPIAAIIGGPGVEGLNQVPNAGPDGSTAFHVGVGAGGGTGGFGMPFFDFFNYKAPLDSAAGCQVVCEANMRVVHAPDGTSIIEEMELWSIVTSPELAPVIANGEWFHVRIQLLPDADGGAMRTLTMSNAESQVSTTSTVPVLGTELSYGLFRATGPAEVFLDDLTCQISTP